MKKSGVKESEQWIKVVFNKTPLPILIISVDELKFLAANIAAQEQFGYKNEELLQMHLEDMIFEEDYQRVVNELDSMENGKDAEFITKNIKKNNEIIDVKIVATLVKYENKPAILKIATDITEQIKSAAIIEKQKLYFDELFYAAPFAIALSDLKHAILKINKGFEILFKYSDKEIAGKSIKILVPDDKMDEYHGIQEQFELHRVVVQITVRMASDKSPIDVLMVRYPLVSNDVLVGYYTLYLDISEHKKVERKLAENEEKIRKIIDTAIDAVVSMDEEGVVTAWNYQAEKTFGYKKSEAIGNQLCKLIIPLEHRGNFTYELSHFLENRESRFLNKKVEVKAITKNNEKIPVELAILPVKVADKYCFTAFIRDISKQKEWQQQLIGYNMDLEKANAELDRFVYSVSHDLRAPLTNVMGLLYILENGSEEARSQIVEKIKNTLNRLDVLIKTILEYSRNARLQIKPSTIDIKSLVEDAWDYYSYIKGAGKVKLNLEITEDSPFVSDKDRINIIINNLISNAVKYIDQGKENPYVHVQVKINKEKAFIKFEDNGIGIKSEFKDKIFDMFFRGTEISDGSGLGLYLVKEVISYLNGKIEVDSKPDEGTTFFIELPNLISKSE